MAVYYFADFVWILLGFIWPISSAD